MRLDGFHYSLWATRADSANEEIRRALSSFESYIYQSNFSYRAFRDVAGHDAPGLIVPNGAQPLNWGVRSGNYVTCVADWRPNKRLKDIVAAFSDCRLSDVKLIVIGNNPDKSLIHRASSNVSFVGRKANRITRRLVASSLGLIHIAWIDNCPNAVVEALVDGIPVLTNNNGGTKEIVRQNGLSLDLEAPIDDLSACNTASPPPVNLDMLIGGVHTLLEVDRGFERHDLHIGTIANKYVNYLVNS